MCCTQEAADITNIGRPWSLLDDFDFVNIRVDSFLINDVAQEANGFLRKFALFCRAGKELQINVVIFIAAAYSS